MFGYADIPSLSIPKLNMSNAVEGYNMFRETTMDTLDLSMLDTSFISGTHFSGMLDRIKATKCYARTQEDADRLNATGAPHYLHWSDLEHPFVVK